MKKKKILTCWFSQQRNKPGVKTPRWRKIQSRCQAVGLVLLPSYQEVDVHPPEQRTVRASLCRYGAFEKSTYAVAEATLWQDGQGGVMHAGSVEARKIVVQSFRTRLRVLLNIRDNWSGHSVTVSSDKCLFDDAV